eukprot:TRINITY_DN10758_c0_g1_i1.p1 TRINITY_DN10758_c0_g1~~TRINITY_DN10758_c0_g1_i1.p1  ORF type:complete len:106 (+),score=27.79 TRINITY_DN10758_c0_g1_i1:132-449(+)
MSQETITIKYRMHKDEECKFISIPKESQVWELKEKIGAFTGLKPSQQTLYLNTQAGAPKPLVSHRTVQDYFPTPVQIEKNVIVIEGSLLGGFCFCCVDGIPCCCP